MRTSFVLRVVAWSCLCSLATALQALRYPSLLSSSSSQATNWEATLSVQPFRFDNGVFEMTTRAYCLEGSCEVPGPTILLRPGDNFSLTLVNNLGRELSPPTKQDMNTLHAPNTTNIHTHGLHISPISDDVFSVVSPGENFTYRYQIPADHAPGFHWYHAHHHGGTTLQVMNGLVGAIVVLPSVHDNIPKSISDADSRVLVFTIISFNQSVDHTSGEVSQACHANYTCDPISQAPLCRGDEQASPYNPFRIYSLHELEAESGGLLDYDITVKANMKSSSYHYLVNGMYQPLMQDLIVNTTIIFRMLFAVGGGLLRPTINSLNCSMRAIAFDGIYLKDKQSSPNDKGFVFMEGSRIDMEIICTERGVFEVKSLSNILFHINVSRGDVGSNNPTYTDEIVDSDLEGIVRPMYLQDSMEATVDSDYAISFGEAGFNASSGCGYWMGGGDACDNSPTSEWSSEGGCVYAQFNGSRGNDMKKYQESSRHVTALGSVNEWKIYGRADSHPFHVHVNPMQIVSFEGDGTPLGFDLESYFRPGEFRDVVAVLPGVLTVRFRAQDFVGECIYHCHYLRHEDMGMMDSFLIMESTTSADGNNEDVVLEVILIFVFTVLGIGAISIFFGWKWKSRHQMKHDSDMNSQNTNIAVKSPITVEISNKEENKLL